MYPLVVIPHFPLPPACWQLLIYFLSLCLFLFSTFPVNGIIYYMAFCVCNTIRFENVELLVTFPRGPPTFFADLVLKMPVLHARDSYRCWEMKVPCTVSQSELPSFHFHPFQNCLMKCFHLEIQKLRSILCLNQNSITYFVNICSYSTMLDTV